MDLMDDLNWAQSDAEIKEQTRRQKVSHNTEMQDASFSNIAAISRNREIWHYSDGNVGFQLVKV